MMLYAGPFVVIAASRIVDVAVFVVGRRCVVDIAVIAVLVLVLIQLPACLPARLPFNKLIC